MYKAHFRLEVKAILPGGAYRGPPSILASRSRPLAQRRRSRHSVGNCLHAVPAQEDLPVQASCAG